MGLPCHGIQCATLFCTAAMALCAGPIASHAADAAIQVTVGELVVTAQKRAERSVDAPVSISAIGGQALQDQADVKFSDYLDTVPGLEVSSNREGSALLILRGIATGAANPTVATYVDEAPFGSSTIFALGAALTPDIDPGDLDHIEILSGPQGTLYGANAIGGIVKFVTTPPHLTTFGGRLETSGEDVSHGSLGWGVRGSVNVPLVTDKLAIRVSGYDRHDPGFIDDVLHGAKDINGARVYGGRIEALWQAADTLKIRLTALQHVVTSPNDDVEDVTQVQVDANHGYISGPTEGDLEVARFVPQPLEIQYGLYNGTATWSPGPVTLMSSTSYSTERVDAYGDLTAQYGPLLNLFFPTEYPPDVGVSLLRRIRQTKFTEEVQLASAGESKVDWLVGGYFTHEVSSADDPIFLYTFLNDQPYAPPDAAFANVFHATLFSHYTEESAYGDVDYHFTPKFDITVGGRYSHDSQVYSQPSSGLLFGPPSDLHVTGTESAFTFLVNPRYALSSDNTLYIRIASGYRPGGPNAAPPAVLNFPAAFGPDFLTDYEAGWKAVLLDHTLSVDSSVFYLRWSKMQLPTVIGGFSAQANGGAAHSAGADAQANWTPIRGLGLEADATYTNAVMDSNSPTAGAFKGNHLPLEPTWNWGLGASYAHALAEGWGGFVGANYRYIGQRPNVFAVNTATSGYYIPLPGYYTLDLRAGATHEKWEVLIFARNVTDQRGITSLGANTGVLKSSSYNAAVINPRTIGVSLSSKF